ncbi:MAG: hypothetical protein WBK28_02180, partial [Minisyncoccia bacterium]
SIPPVEPPSDAAHTFRTYASDVATLTGKPLGNEVRNEPAVVHHKPAASVHTPSVPSESPDPSPNPTATPSTPTRPPPLPPPPAKIVPRAPTTSETRDEVLARLRQKAGREVVETSPRLPVPPAPSTNETKEQVLARLKAKAGGATQPFPLSSAPAPLEVVPPLPPHRDAPVSSSEPSPLHTYKTDFAGFAEQKGASRISMLAAEQDAGQTTTPVSIEKPKGNMFVIAAGILLLVAGMGSVYAAYRFATGRPPIPEELFVPSLIFADERAELSGEGAALRESLVTLTTRTLPEGSVVVAYLSYATTSAEGVETSTLPGNALIARLALPAPDILLRNIETPSMVGVVTVGGQTRPFFILRVSSYERTFAGMLEWEARMERDLASFYPRYTNSALLSETQNDFSIRIGFRDEVVGNRDVRVLRDSADRAVLLYGYRDKKTLLIARDEGAFLELLERLEASRSQ